MFILFGFCLYYGTIVYKAINGLLETAKDEKAVGLKKITILMFSVIICLVIMLIAVTFLTIGFAGVVPLNTPSLLTTKVFIELAQIEIVIAIFATVLLNRGTTTDDKGKSDHTDSKEERKKSETEGIRGPKGHEPEFLEIQTVT